MTQPAKATVDTFQIVVFKLENYTWQVVDTIPDIKVITSERRWEDFDYDAMLSNGDSTIVVTFIHVDTLYYAKGLLMSDGTWHWNIEQMGTGYMFPLSVTQYNGHFHVFLSKNGAIWDVDLDTSVQLQISCDNASSSAPVAPDSNIVLWMEGDNSHKICFSYRDGSTWSEGKEVSQDYNNAVYPNALHIPSSPLYVYIYAEGDSAPYNITVGRINEDYLIKNLQATLQEDNSVRLEWTCNATSDAEFEIQRKKVGGEWVSIYTGSCNFSNGTFSYVDHPPLFSDFFYRVKVIDYLQSGTWSEKAPLLMAPYLTATCQNSTAFNNTRKLIEDVSRDRLYYVQKQTGGYFLSIMYSDDYGATWNTLKSIFCNNLATEPAIGLVDYNNSNSVVVTYLDSNKALRYYGYYLTPDTGYIIVPGNVISYSMSAVGEDIYIVWQEPDSELFVKRFKYNNINDTTRWFIGYGTKPSIYAASSNEIAIAWEQDNQVKVREIYLGNSQTTYTLGTGKNPSIVTNSYRHIETVYQSNEDIVYREALEGTRWEDPEILDVDVDNDAYPQIAVTPNFSAVAWVKDSSVYVRFLPTEDVYIVGSLYNPRYPQIVAWQVGVDSAYIGVFYSTDSSYVPFRKVGVRGNFISPMNGITSNNSVIPDSFSVVVKNCIANGIISLSYAVPSKGNIQINVYDVTGRKTKGIRKAVGKPGIYEYNLSLSDMQRGIYFLEVRYGGKREIKRILLVR